MKWPSSEGMGGLLRLGGSSANDSAMLMPATSAAAALTATSIWFASPTSGSTTIPLVTSANSCGTTAAASLA